MSMFIRPLKKYRNRRLLLLSLAFFLSSCGKDAQDPGSPDGIKIIHGRCADNTYGKISKNKCFSGRYVAGRGFSCDINFGTLNVSSSDSWQCLGINGGTDEQCAYINNGTCFGSITALIKRENGDCYAACLK